MTIKFYENGITDGTDDTKRVAFDVSGFTASDVKTLKLGAITTDNDGSFDMLAASTFKCTPTGSITLTFTNIRAGVTGMILLVNGSNYAVSAHANTKINSGDLSNISATGTYLLSYVSDGTNVYVVASKGLTV